jgi:hypothetical protein
MKSCPSGVKLLKHYFMFCVFLRLHPNLDAALKNSLGSHFAFS